MARYIVLAKDGPDAFEHAVFLRDGFNFGAFAFGPFWLLRHGCWRAGLLVLVGLGCFAAAILAIRTFAAGMPAEAVALTLLLLQILMGFEGASLRRWELGRRGFRDIGLVAGADLDALEQRFFAGIMAADGSERPVQAPLTAADPSSQYRATDGVLGLFPSPAGRSGQRP